MLKRLIASLALALVMPAQANSFSTDASDLWWNATESGWGVNVIHENEVLFLTFYVYGPTGAPVWYSASDVRYTGQQGNALVFTGDLYQTNGPWLGGAYNEALVGYRKVGTTTFTMNSIVSATLAYTVDGTQVTKPLTRYTWRINDVSGTYLGASAGTASNCSSPSDNGYDEEDSRITITQTQIPSAVTMRVVESGATCTYSGAYVQDGRMGSASGSYSCTNGIAGTFQAFEIEANVSGFTARMTASGSSCNWSGRIAGVRTGS